MNLIISNYLSRYFTFIICSVFVFSCSIQENKTNSNHKPIERTHYTAFKLKGKVKSLKQYEVTPNDHLIISLNLKFNRLGQTTEISGENLLNLFKYNKVGEQIGYQRFKNGVLIEKDSQIDSFDNNGNIIKRFYFDEHDSLRYTMNYTYNSNNQKISASSTNFIQKYIYDNEGILREDNFILYGKDSVQERNYKTIYNEDGKIVLDLRLRSQKLYSKESYEYDTLGNLIKLIFTNHDTTSYTESLIKYNHEGIKTDSISRYFAPSIRERGQIIIHHEDIYKYNNLGNITVVIIKSEDRIISSSKYKYNKRNTLIEKIIKYSDSEIIITYDKKGNEILNQEYDKNKILVHEKKHEFEYDSRSNFTEVRIFIDGELDYHGIREYEYYW